MQMRGLGRWAAMVALLIATTGLAQGGTYPVKPVTMITPSPAGAGPDVIARVVAERLTYLLNRQVLVLNRAGAGGLLAAEAAAKAAPDGYTIFMPISSTFVVLPETQPRLPFDLARDFAPIGMVGEQPMLVTVHPSLPVNSLQDLIALAGQRPGQLLFGAGQGFLPHLTGELFQRRTGIKLMFVPYSSTAKAMQDAIGGTLNVFFESLSALSGPIQAGSLKPLAVASAKRLPELPDVPTVAEALHMSEVVEARGWFALMARAGTPADIMDLLGENLRRALDDPDLKHKFATLGTYPRPLSAAETLNFIHREQDLWRPIVRQVKAESQQ